MNHDDPKLTAFALDEIDASDRAEIEQLLRDDAMAQGEVDATRAFAAKLRTHLQAVPAEPLTGEQRDKLLAADADTQAPGATEMPRSARRSWSSMALKIAACLAAGAVLAGLLFPVLNSAKQRAGQQSRETDSRPVLAPPTAPAEPEQEDGHSLKYAQAEPTDKAGKPAAPPALTIAQAGRVDRQRISGSESQDRAMLGPQAGSKSLSELRKEVDEAYKELRRLGVEQNILDLNPDMFGAETQNSEYADTKNKYVSAKRILDASQMRVTTTGVDESITRPPQVKESAEGEESMTQTFASSIAGSLPSNAALTATPQSASSGGSNLFAAVEQRDSAQQGGAAGGKPLALDALGDTTVPGRGSGFGNQRDDVRRKLDGLRESEALHREPQPAAEAYEPITDNAFLRVSDQPLSTFSIDVDTASYANVRRFLNSNRLPPKAAVRIEEMVNYFTYDYPQPDGDSPFSSTMEVAACPWQPQHQLVRIGLKGREVKRDQRPPSNLVFLIDVSGSMQPENKLPLLKRSMQLLVDQLTPRDQVAIVVYAGASGVVLEPSSDKERLRAALDRLDSGGSTNGGAGIQLAYQLAERNFLKEGTNRVILATDGDFNVGVTNRDELTDLVEKKAKSGVFLTVLGFGMDNLKDATLEKLADKGNGNYAYIDTLNEGRKVFVEQMAGTLVTIAKDVKIQIEFNPAQVSAYRLIGYENRLLKKEDFNDDTKDAGEIGAGHTVTALYEVVPFGQSVTALTPNAPGTDPLKYQSSKDDTVSRLRKSDESVVNTPQPAVSPELLTLKLRYKAPDADVSKKLEFPLTDSGATWEKSSRDFRFAAAMASFGMLLRESPHKGSATWNSTLELAQEGLGADVSGYRAEFVGLVEKARALAR